MNRAYSLLEIKSVDEAARVIEGLATTPETDRMGDIVEPRGAEFTLPLPLLWQHDAGSPIGHVIDAKVTDEGIWIRAQIESDENPGSLKDLLDKAWGAIKKKLVRGLSIGFRAIESQDIKGTWGQRFTRWDWLELSAVTIPANAGASIQTIKSHDFGLQAASGQRQHAVVRLGTSPGASGGNNTKPKPQEGQNMNVQEQIKQFEATRQAKAAAMDEIMSKSAEKGETLDAEQSEAYDTFKGEVDTIDKHLERLRAHEKAMLAKAAPVHPVQTGGSQTDGEPTQRASNDRGGKSVIGVERKLAKGIAFARFAGALAHAKGNWRDAGDFYRERFPEEKGIQPIFNMFANYGFEDVMKAAVAAGTTGSTTWAAPLVQFQQMSEEFIEWLRPQTIIGKIDGLRRVPFNIRMPRQTSGGSAYWVGEGAPKPLTSLAFDNVTLKWTKLATIAVITEELARLSTPSAETIIRDTLADAIVQQMDADFVNPANAGTADVKPASITNGVTAVASSGTDASAVREDIRAVFAPFIAANLTPANGVWLMSATTALALSLMMNSQGQREFPGITMSGGTFNGMPVVVSEAIGNIVILVNARDILLADDGQVSIDVSREASLQMADNPATPDATTVYRSLWQDNLIGIKAERFINWVKARSAAAQYLSGVAYAP